MSRRHNTRATTVYINNKQANTVFVATTLCVTIVTEHKNVTTSSVTRMIHPIIHHYFSYVSII